jgi:hypothetical protein
MPSFPKPSPEGGYLNNFIAQFFARNATFHQYVVMTNSGKGWIYAYKVFRSDDEDDTAIREIKRRFDKAFTAEGLLTEKAFNESVQRQVNIWASIIK